MWHQDTTNIGTSSEENKLKEHILPKSLNVKRQSWTVKEHKPDCTDKIKQQDALKNLIVFFKKKIIWYDTCNVVRLIITD